mmetsp:Transcript_108384/g.312255  ORF Transcript_108384/g.312255 Transcript_108384/m.312255 type:complete len:332 (-) Transcript_108384:318-1313(-)
MLSKSITTTGILSVLLSAQAAGAFVLPSKGGAVPPLTLQQLQPDGFLGGDRFSSYNNQGYGYRDMNRRENNRMEQEINAEEGGPLARVGLGPDGSPQGNPMIRMDASAPRQQSSQRSTIQGAGSRATWVSPDPYGFDEMNVHLGTAGRPLFANVEHWSGPNNTPSRMLLMSEDGGARPWMTKFRTPTNVHSGVTQVRNMGPMEFPIEASVTATNSPERSGISTEGMIGAQMTKPRTIDGGALKTFGFDHSVDQVYLEISSDGLPINARIELWQGPSNTKAIGKIYTDHGLKRPWSALIPLPGYGASICVINEGPMTYPIKVSMDPPPKTIM